MIQIHQLGLIGQQQLTILTTVITMNLKVPFLGYLQVLIIILLDTKAEHVTMFMVVIMVVFGMEIIM